MNIEVKRINEARVRYYGVTQPWREKQLIDLDMSAPGIVSEADQRYREVYAAIDLFSETDHKFYTVHLELILTLENDCRYILLDRRPVIKKEDNTAILNAVRRSLKKNGNIYQYIVDMVQKLADGISAYEGMVPSTSMEEMDKFREE